MKPNSRRNSNQEGNGKDCIRDDFAFLRLGSAVGIPDDDTQVYGDELFWKREEGCETKHKNPHAACREHSGCDCE